MAGSTGTHDVSSLLASRLASIQNFEGQNLQKIQDLVNEEVAVHNEQMLEMVGELADVTTAKDGVYGSNLTGSMDEVDEYGRVRTQKPAPGETFGIPLRKFAYAVGWTAQWFKQKSPVDLAIAIGAAERADRLRVQYEIKKALLISGNYSFYDYLINGALVGGSSGVKRLLNADSATIPVGPNGATFDGSSHTHYVGEASLTAAFFHTEVLNVSEHGHTGNLRAYINIAQEATVRAFTDPVFTPYVDARIINQTAGGVARKTLDPTAPRDNRAIGLCDGCEVWVKPWMPANYVFFFDAAGPKPLWFRQPAQGSLQGLQLEGTNMAFPLQADYYARQFGVGVYTRTNGSAFYLANATYADFAAAAP